MTLTWRAEALNTPCSPLCICRSNTAPSLFKLLQISAQMQWVTSGKFVRIPVSIFYLPPPLHYGKLWALKSSNLPIVAVFFGLGVEDWPSAGGSFPYYANYPVLLWLLACLPLPLHWKLQKTPLFPLDILPCKRHSTNNPKGTIWAAWSVHKTRDQPTNTCRPNATIWILHSELNVLERRETETVRVPKNLKCLLSVASQKKVFNPYTKHADIIWLAISLCF